METSVQEIDRAIARGEADAASDLLQRALRRPCSPSRRSLRATVLLRAAFLDWLCLRTTDAIENARRAVEYGSGAPSGAAFSANLLLAQLHNARSEPKEALRYVSEARSACPVAATKDLPQLFNASACAHASLGNAAQALRHFEIAVELSQSSSNRGAYIGIFIDYGISACSFGRGDLREPCHAMAHEIALAQRPGRATILTGCTLAATHVLGGRPRAALSELESFAGIPTFPRDRAMSTSVALRAHTLLGDPESAARSLDETLASQVLSSDEPQLIGPFVEAQCRYYLASGQGRRCDELLEAAVERSHSAEELWGTLVLVAQRGTPRAVAQARALFADISREHFVNTAFGQLFEAVQANRRGDEKRARTLAGKAGWSFEKLGWPYFAAISAEEVRRVGGKARAGRPRQTLRAVTERQEGIIRRLFEGHTNAEIATAMDVSRSTIDHHIGEIYRRLRVRNRSGLLRLGNGLPDDPDFLQNLLIHSDEELQ